MSFEEATDSLLAAFANVGSGFVNSNEVMYGTVGIFD
jgi:hypothetical protein